MCIPVISDAITVTISEVDPQWKPKASTKEELSVALVDVTISEIDPDKDRLKVIEITLQETTNNSGICCNSIFQDIKDTGLKDVYDKSNGKDLIFRQEENAKWTVVGNLTLRYQIPSSNTSKEVDLTVGVLSLDYGGYGELKGRIYKVKGLFDELAFEFGTESQKKKYTLQETVKGYTQVPRDKNYNGIADSWHNDYYAINRKTGKLDRNLFRNFGNKEDADPSPGSNYKGDHITAYEEYRGVMVIISRPGFTPVTVKHKRTSPDIKDMFVVNEDSETASYGYGTPLPHISQHLITSSRTSSQRLQKGMVNFRENNEVLSAYSALVVSDDAIGGDTPFGYAPIGPPGLAKNDTGRKATIYTSNIRLVARVDQTKKLIRDTIGHELGHLAHLDHCPKSDEPDAKGKSWKTRCLMFGEGHVDQSSFASHHDADYALALPVEDPQIPHDHVQPKENAVKERGTLVPANRSYSAEAGDRHTAKFSTSSPYSSVYWSVKKPSDTTSTSLEIDKGDGSLTTADFTYTFPRGVSGDYVFNAYVYDGDNTTVYEESYTVSVSLPSSTTSTSSSSYSLVSSDGVYTATAGTSHEANFTASQAYDSVSWYLKRPSDASAVYQRTDSGNGSSTTSQFGYTFPSGVSGDYVFKAKGTTGSKGFDVSYTVSVSLPPVTLVSSDGVYTAKAGDSHTAKLSASSPYSLVYWYVKPPLDTSGSGKIVEIDKGDGSSTSADMTYTFASDAVAGAYVIIAYVYPVSGEVSIVRYTVMLSSGTVVPPIVPPIVPPVVPPIVVTRVPGVPTGLTSTVSNGKVTLSWTVPTDDGGGIDNYQYRVDKNSDGTWGGWIDVAAGSTSVDVSVENGVDYAFQVRSKNSAGNSTSVKKTALPIDSSVSTPSVPRNLSAAADAGQVRLSWDAPATGTPVIAYEYTYDTGNDGSWRSWKLTKSTGTSHTVTGLTNNTVYAFKVRARNTGGIGTESSKVTATPFSYKLPGNIRNLTASITSDNKVRLDWDAPLDDGGTPITGYGYISDTNNDGTWSIWRSTGDSSTDKIFGWVRPGVTYAFIIHAVNKVGSGGSSDKVVIRVPTVPSQPLNFTASLTSDGYFNLDWDTPTSDGGRPITRYDYYIYADDGYGEQWLSTGSTLTEKSIYGGGFEYGMTYTFKVRAVNQLGVGASSDSVEITPTVTLPSAPQSLIETAGNAGVYLSWSEPADDGYSLRSSSRYLTYQYRYRQSGGTWNAWGSEQSDRYATISNLINGTTYEFEVHAVNDAGTGPAATISSTPTGTAVPGVPQYFITRKNNGAVELDWDPPKYDGGSAITDYEYRYKKSSSSIWNGWTSAGNANAEYPKFIVTGLTNGTSYDFQVRAKNAVGPGTGTEILTETPKARRPDAPTGLSATAGTTVGTVVLAWTVPANNGSPITDYKFAYVRYNNGWRGWTDYASTGSTSATYTVTGLQSGKTYRFRVCAVNGVGEGSVSRVAQIRVP